jgi:cytochrome b5-like protein
MRPLRTPPAPRALAPVAAGRHPADALLPGGRAVRECGLADLAERNDDEHGWWLALDGRVHDVTGLVRCSPAGAVLRASAGLDVTTAADRGLLDRPGLRQLLAATDAGPLVRPFLDRARGLHDAWVGALSGLVSLQNAFRQDRSCAECTDPCPADGDLPCPRRAATTAACFGDEHLPRFAAEVLAPLAEQVLREQRATALRIRTVAGGPGGGLLPGCSPRRRLELLDRRIGATKALLTRGVRCFDRWGDAVLGTGELWRLAAQAVPGCAGATTLSVCTTRRAG